MSMINETNSVQLFLRCSEALEVLARGETPKDQQAVPQNLRLSPSLRGGDIAKRVGNIIQKIFAEDKSTRVEAKDIIVFLERWTRYADCSRNLSLQDKNRVIRDLFTDNLVYSPFKVIEVLQARPPARLSCLELRALEKDLAAICSAHENFMATIYSFYVTYLGGLLSVQMKQAGAEMTINNITGVISVDWEKMSLASPEAITIVARFKDAQKKHVEKKILREVFQNLPSLDQESRKVVTICILDCLWDKIASMDDHFWDCVSYASTEEVEDNNVLHPLIKRSLKFLDEFWTALDFDEKKYGQVYEPASNLQRKKMIVRQLNVCARCYQDQFSEIASLYEKGYQLYEQARALNNGFTVVTTQTLPLPEEFAKNAIHTVSFEVLDAMFPSTLEELGSFVLNAAQGRTRTILTRMFHSPEVVEGLVEDYFYTTIQEKKFAQEERSPDLEESSPDIVASSYLPESLLHAPKKMIASFPSPKKKKKTAHASTLLPSMEELSLSPPSSTFPAGSASEKTPFSALKKQRVHTKKIHMPPPPPPAPIRPSSPWLTPSCLEGCSSMIFNELNLFPIVRHKHVKNQFDVKAEMSGDIPRELLRHTYPTIIAGLIQRNSDPRYRYSEHRKSYDLAYSCVGTVEEYGKKRQPRLGRFTEAFFSEDTVDGKKGELFHHCFFENTAGACIAQFQRNAAFDADAEIEDVLNDDYGSTSPVMRPFSRFRVMFRPYSCVVNDMVERVFYTIAFTHKIAVKAPS